MRSVDNFVVAMRDLFATTLDEAMRWEQVKPLLNILLADPELAEHAKTWPVSHARSNLLFYEDPDYGFVINGLIKNPDDATRIHDHAHTWTAYGVIEGKERVYNYAVKSEVGNVAEIEFASQYDVKPGHVEVVPPHLPHAEIAETRTVAIIVRSQRLGGFTQRIFDLEAGTFERLPGPVPIPFDLAA